MEVTTYLPVGDTCDMNPKRLGDPCSVKALHRMTYLFSMEATLLKGTSPYNALSFCGPSTSMPSVFPSPEKEWQLAHVGRFCITTVLRGSDTFRRRHLIIGRTESGRGLMTPRSRSFGRGGIRGTSR